MRIASAVSSRTSASRVSKGSCSGIFTVGVGSATMGFIGAVGGWASSWKDGVTIPETALVRATRKSAAVWNLAARSLASAFRTTESIASDTDELIIDGGTGDSLTCW